MMIVNRFLIDSCKSGGPPSPCQLHIKNGTNKTSRKSPWREASDLFLLINKSWEPAAGGREPRKKCIFFGKKRISRVVKKDRKKKNKQFPFFCAPSSTLHSKNIENGRTANFFPPHIIENKIDVTRHFSNKTSLVDQFLPVPGCVNFPIKKSGRTAFFV